MDPKTYQAKKRTTAIVAVYLMLIKRNYNQILLSRRFNTGYMDGFYNFPSGHIEGDQELPMEAMIREAKEEIGVSININHLDLFHASYRPKHDGTGNRMDLFFLADSWDGEIKNMEPHKCDDLNWFDLNRLPPNITAHNKHAIECFRNGIPYSELGEEWLKANGQWELD